MKKILLSAATFALILIFLIAGLSLINRPITENDEGIYWTSFLLYEKGYNLYSQISFSQLPGFLVSVFPIFKILGSSIEAARLGTLFWSAIALVSILYMSYIKKNPILGIVTIVLILATPVFFNQAITLQSDVVATSFSTVSFVLMLKALDSRFRGNDIGRIHYLIFSAIFFSLALLTKFDFSLILPFGYILIKQKVYKATNIFYFGLFSLIFTFFILSQFGLSNVIGNVVALREKAALLYQFKPLIFFDYLSREVLLAFIFTANIIFYLLIRKKEVKLTILNLWFLGSFILVYSFRPLFQHHLVFLIIPSVLLFTQNIFSYSTSIKRLIEVSMGVALIISVISFSNNFEYLHKNENNIKNKERQIARNFILKFSDKNDFIVTDEAALYGLTGRLPPPELADLSQVQIKSGNVSKEKFKSVIQKYNPKLIMIWNGRLNPLEKFIGSTGLYYKTELGKYKKIFIRQN